MQAGRVKVEVVCVAGGLGFAKAMDVPVGQTIGWCVNASGLYGLHPQLRGMALGVWGKKVEPETVVAGGDRIEVYRPCDPQAVAQARKRGKAIANGGD